MKEIEVKILNIPQEQVIAKLEELGAKKEFEGTLVDQVFDFEDKRLKKAMKQLRLRSKGEQHELAIKHTLDTTDLKIMEEHEVCVSNPKELVLLLGHLGLIKQRTRTKHRISYKLEKVRFELDTYEDVPTFLEIEASNENVVRKYVELLGYTLEQTKAITNSQLLKLYNKKIGE